MEESAVELNVDFEPGPLGLELACSGDHLYNTQISGIKPTGAVCTYNQGVEEKRQLKTGMVLVRLGERVDFKGMGYSQCVDSIGAEIQRCKALAEKPKVTLTFADLEALLRPQKLQAKREELARQLIGDGSSLGDVQAPALPSKVDALSVKQLKEQLVLRGVKFADCREKCELVDRLKQALLDDEMEGVGPSQYASPQTTPVVSPATAPPAASPPPV
jgi:hypothetical protein